MSVDGKEKRIAVTVWLTPSIRKEMKHEGVDRNMSMGDLIEEAWNSRPRMIVREGMMK